VFNVRFEPNQNNSVKHTIRVEVPDKNGTIYRVTYDFTLSRVSVPFLILPPGTKYYVDYNKLAERILDYAPAVRLSANDREELVTELMHQIPPTLDIP